MKTAAQRDAMVTRVNAAVAKWPTLLEMPVNPELPKGSSVVTVDVGGDTLKSNAGYVAALYELAKRGAVPVGRSKDATVIVGQVTR